MAKKFLHKWGEWVYYRDECISIRKCTREDCDYCREEKETHDFGDWVYRQSDSCTQIRRCRKCGKIDVRKNEHIFGEWSYHSPNCCEGKRVCSHCGYTEFRISHGKRAVISRDGECVKELRCTRCGDTIIQQKEHSWVEQELPYVECLDHAIDYIENKKESLIELAQLKQENPLKEYQDFQYATLIAECGRLAKKLELLKDKKRLASPDDVGKFCTNCKEVLYLGKRNLRNRNIKGFLSYSWANTEFAEQIDRSLKNNGIYITRDIRDLDIGTKIQAFMDRVAESKYVIVILSDSYLRSKNCMYEAVKVVLTLVKKQCILLPIVVNLDISNKELWGDYEKYWLDKIDEEKGKQESLHEIIIYQSILDSFREFLSLIIEYKYEKVTSIEDINAVMIHKMIGRIKSIPNTIEQK